MIIACTLPVDADGNPMPLTIQLGPIYIESQTRDEIARDINATIDAIRAKYPDVRMRLAPMATRYRKPARRPGRVARARGLL